MEILEPRDLKGIQHKSGYGLKSLGKNEIYIEKLNQPATNLILFYLQRAAWKIKQKNLKNWE